MSLPPELVAIRDEAMQTSCESWAGFRGWKLSKGIDQAGPCPVLGCAGTDRFAIHIRKNTFFCRRCGLAGVGVIELVMKVEGVGFVDACEIITGRKASAPIDEKRAAEIAASNAAAKQKSDAEEARYREQARKKGYEIFCAASWDWSGPVFEYLAMRGINLAAVEAQGVLLSSLKLRQHMALPYFDSFDGKVVRLHTGPAMVIPVQMPDGHFGAAHMTWLDLAQDKGKYVPPPFDTGKPRPSKKVRGVMKGGAMRLYTPPNPTRLVMGEGSETTLTALGHNLEPDTAYWAGVSLGNMAGKAARNGAGKFIHDAPDLDDFDCFIPPDWVRELVFLCDSDEAETRTVDKITRGLLRAEALRPDLKGFLVPPIGEGKDLNDLVRVTL